MKLIKNILSVTALVAVLIISSFSASAERINEVKDRTLDKSYGFVYDKLTVQTIIKYINYCAPYTLDKDYELTSLDMDVDNDVINFNTTVDYATCVAIEELDDDTLKALESAIAASLYDMFESLGLDDNGDSIMDFMQDSDIKVNYNFYIKGIGVPVKTFKINPQLIERVGLISNNIYSI